MRKINTKTLQDILKVASVIAAVGLLFIILILARVLDSRLKDGSPKDRTAYEESIYTAPASISGLPVLVAQGVQVIGKPFSENSLLDMAKELEKEDK